MKIKSDLVSIYELAWIHTKKLVYQLNVPIINEIQNATPSLEKEELIGKNKSNSNATPQYNAKPYSATSHFTKDPSLLRCISQCG